MISSSIHLLQRHSGRWRHRSVLVAFLLAGANPCPAQVAVDAELITLVLGSGDARILALGDSFTAPLFARVFPAIVTEWGFGPLTAVAGGAGPNARIVQGVPLTPAQAVQAPPDGYELLRNSPQTEFFALPLRGMHELYFSPTGDLVEGDGLITVWLWLNSFSSRGMPFAVAGQTVRMRPLLYSPINQALRASSVLVDNVETQLIGPPGDIGALPELDLIVQDGATRLGVTFGASESSIDSGTYFHPAGAVFYHIDSQNDERIPGLYYSYLADNSWSYTGFAADRRAQSNADKSYSIDQMSAWLVATTIDANQPLIAFYYLAAEAVGADGGEAVFAQMVDQTREAAQRAGLGLVIHCLVLPHFHSIGGDANRHDLFVAQRDAMFRLAGRRADVAAISLYDATNGELLPDFLDGALLHPNQEGADFFARLLAMILSTPTSPSCLGDSNDDLVVNFADITETLSNWLNSCLEPTSE